MSTHVLITGGAGYLGSVLTHRLLIRGYRVTVLDNFMYRQASLSHLCSESRLNIVNGDVRDSRVLEPLLKDADVIVPLAAIVGAPACDKDYFSTGVNLGAIQGMINYLSLGQIVVFPNTNSGYGVGGESYCTEASPLVPLSKYGRDKVKAEHALLGGFANSVSLRFATLFGASPRMRLDLMVNDFVYKAMRDRYLMIFEGHFRRNFLHVKDAADAIEFAIQNAESMCGRAFNCGRTDANMTKMELARKVASFVTGTVIVQEEFSNDPDKRDYVVSNERLERLGWRAVWSVHDGIKELMQCYRQSFEVHRNA